MAITMKGSLVASTFAALTLFSALAPGAVRIHIGRNTVIPVIFEDTIDLKHSRRGDRFYTKIDDGQDLPWGTRLVGHIVSIRTRRDNRPGFVDLQFDEMILPDGVRHKIDGIPIQMNKHTVRRGRDGRLIGMRDDYDRENTVAGSTLGGLLLGSIVKKPVEGAIIGAIAGVVAAESDNREHGDSIVKEGDRMGALFDSPVDFVWNGEFRRYKERDREDEARIDREMHARRDKDHDDDILRPGEREREREQDRRREPKELEIRFSDKTLDFRSSETPYRDGGIVMLPMNATSKQVKVEVEAGRGQQYYLTSAEGTYRIEVGSSDARWNGKKVTLKASVVDKSGVLYVPAEVFRALTNDSLRISGN